MRGGGGRGEGEGTGLSILGPRRTGIWLWNEAGTTSGVGRGKRFGGRLGEFKGYKEMCVNV